MAGKIKHWKTLASKTILKHAQLEVVEDIAMLPNGTKIPYVRFADAETQSVIIIAINAKNEILIQREYSHPPHKIMWQLPGGSMKKGESILVAARRELSEESGYSSNRSQVIGSFYIQNRLSNKKQYVVACSDLYVNRLTEDDDEFIETNWMTKLQVSDMITKGQFDNINLLAALNIWFHSSGETS